jgi:Ca2+-binding RTX toxin-like protein
MLVTGDSGDNLLIGGPENDTLLGFGGNDTLDGGGGKDSLNGGAGADSFRFTGVPSNSNFDRIADFSSGVDQLLLDPDVFAGAGAAGSFWAAPGATRGHDADDRIVYNTSTGFLYYDADGNGGGGARLIAVLQGAPTLAASDIAVADDSPPDPDPMPIVGTEGDDTLFGTGGDDLMDGRGGNDSLIGAGGDDTLLGGTGNDSFDGGMGADSITGGSGSDEFLFRSPQSAVDRITDFVSGSDTLAFDNNAFTEIGAFGEFAAGDDRFFAGAGATGGQDAEDRVVYDTSTGNLYYDANGSGAGGAQLIAVLEGEPALSATDITVVGLGGATIEGSQGPDRLMGTPFDDTILGRGGNDTIAGAGGNDWLEGGTGQDQVNGGAGNDSFVFREAPTNSNFDRIADFTSGADTLRLDDAAFANIGAEGDFAAGDDRFFAGAGARAGQDAEDRLVYNTSTGALWYDADGSGSGGQQLVATLQGAPTLGASDIAVI